MLYLSIPSRINFRQLGRYSCFGEQGFGRQFEKRFDFFGLNKSFSIPWIGSCTAVAFDPSFIRNSSKQTPRIGYFWSGCAGRALHGIEILELQDDADLSYLSTQPKTDNRGRSAKYGGKVDVANLNPEHFTPIENNKGIIAYSGIVYSKAPMRNIILDVEEFLIKGKTTYRLLFSTDTTQAMIDVIDIYYTHYQIEFVFRDAKQFAGLENPQARIGNMLNFHFNTTLAKVNIAKVMQLSDPQTWENSFSMATYKILFHITLMLSRFSGCSPLTRTHSKIVNMPMN